MVVVYTETCAELFRVFKILVYLFFSLQNGVLFSFGLNLASCWRRQKHVDKNTILGVEEGAFMVEGIKETEILTPVLKSFL